MAFPLIYSIRGLDRNMHASICNASRILFGHSLNPTWHHHQVWNAWVSLKSIISIRKCFYDIRHYAAVWRPIDRLHLRLFLSSPGYLYRKAFQGCFSCLPFYVTIGYVHYSNQSGNLALSTGQLGVIPIGEWLPWKAENMNHSRLGREEMQ